MAALETANGDVNEAAQYLLGEQTEQISGTDHDEFPSLSIADIESGQNKDELTIQQVLKNHADRIIDSYDDQKLQVERDDIWRSCLAFYKMGLKDHNQYRCLVERAKVKKSLHRRKIYLLTLNH